VSDSGKNLTTVFVTHAHPDHYFGFPAIKEKFPSARLVALPSTVSEIEKTWEAKVKQWQATYKDKITSKPVIPEPLATNSLDLEGRKLQIVGGQQGDDHDNAYVWIPALRTVIAGDIVYDEVHPWTAETTPEERGAWRATLDKLAALKPEKVIPGHQEADEDHEPENIEFTKKYLADYDAALASAKNAKELESKMKDEYSDASLPVIVKMGAEAAFKPGARSQPAQQSPAQTSGDALSNDKSRPSGAADPALSPARPRLSRARPRRNS
jgi:glyoxylase-like metal-dependent hydrolase (beta-lactamase superfamily II)